MEGTLISLVLDFLLPRFAPAVGILLNYHSERMATISPHR